MKYIRKPFKYSYSNVVLSLIGINTILFFMSMTVSSLNTYLGLIPALIIAKKTYWQLFTYQFMHGSFGHLFFNMISLFIFGVPVERRIGSKEFLLYYLLTGTLCGVLSFFSYSLTGLYYVNLVGASAAIFAVLLLYAVLFPKSVIYLWAVIPIPAPLLILGYAVIELISIFRVSDHIAHSAHFFGLVVAYLYIKIRFGISPLKIWNSKE